MSSKKDRPPRGNATPQAPELGLVQSLLSLGDRLWIGSSCLFGVMICWSFLQPNDSVSVFQGESLPQILGWLLLGLITGLAAWTTGRTLNLSRWHLVVVIGLLLWQVCMTILAGREVNARTAWFGFWQVAALAACYYSGLALLAGWESRAAALVLCIAGCFGSAAVGAHQVLIDMPALRREYAENPDEVLRRSQINAPLGSALRQQFENRLRSPEPFAAFSLANSLAVVLSGGLILALGVTTSGWQKANWLVRGAMLLGITLLGVVWFLTLSRTAYLALAVGLGTWGLGAWLASGNRRRTLRWLLVAAGAVLVMAMLGVTWLLVNDRLVLSEAPKSLAFRLEYWWATLGMLADFGWRGVGLGNFQDYYPYYMLPTASETIADPHNWLLDIAATLSIPTAIVCAVWLTMLLLSGAGQGSRVQRSVQEGGRQPPSDNSDQGAVTVSARWMLMGGGVGSVLCLLLLVLLQGYPLQTYALAGVVGVVLVFLQRQALASFVSGWGSDKGQVVVVYRAAVVTMLVCLLASGSWQATGIAAPMLLLVASLRTMIAPSILKSEKLKSVVDDAPNPLSSSVFVTAVALPALGLFCFIAQCWLPVTQSWAQQALAGGARSPSEQLELVEQALKADPWNAELQESLASALTARGVESSGAEQFRRSASGALEQLRGWLARDGVSQLNWAVAGDRALDLAAKAQDLSLEPAEYLVAARDFYQAAVDRHPTNVARHMQLATVLAILGEQPAALAAVDEAVRLSEQTPHSDKKLAMQQVWLPLSVPELESIDGIRLDSLVQAEPVVDWIRKSTSP